MILVYYLKLYKVLLDLRANYSTIGGCLSVQFCSLIDSRCVTLQNNKNKSLVFSFIEVEQFDSSDEKWSPSPIQRSTRALLTDCLEQK